MDRGRVGVFMGYSDTTNKQFRVSNPELGYTSRTSRLNIMEHIKGGSMELRFRNCTTGPQGTANDFDDCKPRGRPKNDIDTPSVAINANLQHSRPTQHSSDSVVLETGNQSLDTKVMGVPILETPALDKSIMKTEEKRRKRGEKDIGITESKSIGYLIRIQSVVDVEACESPIAQLEANNLIGQEPRVSEIEFPTTADQIISDQKSSNDFDVTDSNQQIL